MNQGPALVTGAAGWLGSRLRLALEGQLRGQLDGHADRKPVAHLRVLAASPEEEAALRSAPPSESRREVFLGDVRDAARMEAFAAEAAGGTLYHCVGVIHPALRTRDFHAINVVGSRHVLEAAERAGVRRAVVMSSNSPFGANPSADHRFDEDSPYAPYMGYGRSKQALEALVAEVQARGAMETVVVRAPWFYGPGQPPRQSDFFRMIRAGMAPIVGGGTNVRSMSYVDDLAIGMLLCAETPGAAGQRYWLSDGEAHTTLEIVETVARVLEKDFGLACKPQRLKLPGFVSDLARLADRTLQAFGLYEQRIHVLSEMNLHIACRIDKARRELGYAPSVGLEEGMRRSIEWCLQQGIEL